VESQTINTLLVGEHLDRRYIGGLSAKVEKLTGKKVQAEILERMPKDKAASCLLVWEKQGEE